jgi:NAD(P)-dependent dehydrogenase (short-subunit alcohol dehydrogenase family)
MDTSQNPSQPTDETSADDGPTVRTLEQSGVVITGGTSGIGLAGARAFLAAGVPRLVLLGRNEERGRAARDATRALAPAARVEFIAGDTNDPGEALRVCQEARDVVGSIDVLVNATAGPYVPQLLYDIPVEDVPKVLAQQALAPLLMTRIVLPWMREQRGGCIINIASDAAKVPTPGESVIGAAMGAILVFSRTVAMEAKRDGIRVNVMTPSLVEGTATAKRLFEHDFSARLFGKASKQAHLGVSTPEDQAELMVFLASPAARRLTGQAISVNGGISAL